MSDFVVTLGDSQSVKIGYKDRRVAVKSYGYDDPNDKNKKTGYKERKVYEKTNNNVPADERKNMEVTCARFKLIEAIVMHDGHEDISKEDMEYAKTLKGSVFGGGNHLNNYKLTNIDDAGNGRTIFTLANGGDKCYVEIDFETDEEKSVRENKENAKAEENRKKQTEARKEQEAKDKKIKEHEENLKNDPIYRFIDKIMNRFGRPYKP